MTRDPAVDRLLAYEEIRQLVARYAVAMDARDVDALVDLFVDDVRVGRDERGRAALKAFFDRTLREVGITILDVGTHVIDFEGDERATGVVYCRGEIQLADRWVVQAIQYRDEYERRDGHWFFVRRTHLLWYGREVGTSPLGLPPANWPEHSIGTGTLPQAWPTWSTFWGEDAPAD
ncbi:MAG TPA: nuclear transport factor 2 family protein [Acidimicrobiia bacterium]|jgi:ketosteroid isomerase-like protein